MRRTEGVEAEAQLVARERDVGGGREELVQQRPALLVGAGIVGP